MIKITPEQRLAYSKAFLELYCFEQVLHDALRDMTAEVLRLEFEKEHSLKKGAGENYYPWCGICGYNNSARNMNPDPRHAYTETDWQKAAHELLTNGDAYESNP